MTTGTSRRLKAFPPAVTLLASSQRHLGRPARLLKEQAAAARLAHAAPLPDTVRRR